MLKALSDLKVCAADAIFVGDSTHDLEAGKAAGCFTVAVEWTAFEREKLEACKPDLWLEKVSEISDLPNRF